MGAHIRAGKAPRPIRQRINETVLVDFMVAFIRSFDLLFSHEVSSVV